MKRSVHRLVVHITAALVLLLPTLLTANMADPVERGGMVAEASAALADIEIEREELRIDMRPLAELRAVEVEAVYHVNNTGEARRLDLRFVSGSPLAGDGTNLNNPYNYQVTLDGRVVTTAGTDVLALSDEWLPPSHTPGIDGDSLRYEILVAGDLLSTAYDEGRELTTLPVLVFSIDLPEGRHTIRVRYATTATSQSDLGPADVWQLAYILAPARRWAGFGTLDAQVLLPPDWQVAVTPAMTRSGDTLTGIWQGLPSDAIALTTQMSVPFWVPWIDLALALLFGVVALVSTVFLARVLGRAVADGKLNRWLRLMITVGWSVVMATGVVVAYLLGVWLNHATLGAQQASGYFYLRGLLEVAALALVTFLMVLVVGEGGGRRAEGGGRRGKYEI